MIDGLLYSFPRAAKETAVTFYFHGHGHRSDTLARGHDRGGTEAGWVGGRVGLGWKDFQWPGWESMKPFSHRLRSESKRYQPNAQGCFERQGEWHIWELNLAPFVQGKVGGFQLPRKQLWICASWNSLCFSPERAPSVPDKGALLFGIFRQPHLGNILFNSLCWWALVKPHVSSEQGQNSSFSLPLPSSPSLSHSHLPTLCTRLLHYESESRNGSIS